MRSRLTLSLAVAALLAPVAGRAQAAAQAAGISTADAAARAFLDSTVALAQRRDTAALRRLADPRFVFVHSTGRVQDLAAFLAFAAQGRQDSVHTLSPPEIRDADAVAYALTHTATWVPGRGWTAFRATDVVLRTPAGLRWLGHQSTALPTAPAFVPLAPAIASSVAGRYVNRHGVARVVSAARDRLLVRTGDAPPVAYGALTAATFHAERGDAFLVFLRDESGRVRYLEVLQRAGAERYERQDAP